MVQTIARPTSLILHSDAEKIHFIGTYIHYTYTHGYAHKHRSTHTYLYITFVNLIEVQMLVHNYFVDYFVTCLTILGKCFRVPLECFLSDVGYLPYLHLVLPFQYIIEIPWAQNLPVLVCIELFLGTLKILSHRILMMEVFMCIYVCILCEQLEIYVFLCFYVYFMCLYMYTYTQNLLIEFSSPFHIRVRAVSGANFIPVDRYGHSKKRTPDIYLYRNNWL